VIKRSWTNSIYSAMWVRSLIRSRGGLTIIRKRLPIIGGRKRIRRGRKQQRSWRKRMARKVLRKGRRLRTSKSKSGRLLPK